MAARYSLEKLRGPIPVGMHILHRCDNPPCVNPDHLFLGDHATNSKDKKEKNRCSRLFGSRNGRAKLTLEQAAGIRAVTDRRYGAISKTARRFGISRGCVVAIWEGTAWR